MATSCSAVTNVSRWLFSEAPLAALPLPPIAGKMLLYGILFGVLDPVLTVACAQVGAQCS
jgi:hypothetical protein